MSDVKPAESNPSSITIFTMVNGMIGGAMLTYPILFRESGIISGIFILIISSLISFKTCKIYVIHLAPQDIDIEDTIVRILGRKWEKHFRLISGYYIMLLCVIYVILIIDQIYNIMYFIMVHSGYEKSIAAKDVDYFVFDRFSKQYLSLIMFVPLVGLIYLKNLAFVARLAGYGALSVLVYFIFLVYQFSLKVAEEGEDAFENVIWFSTDLGKVAGTSAVAFTLQAIIGPLIKTNKNQENNIRDLKVSYAIGLLMYASFGFFGSIAIMGLKCEETIINCFLKDISSVLVELTYLYGLCTVLPCYMQIGRRKLILNYFPEIKPHIFRNFNIIFMSIALLLCFLNPYIKLDAFISLVGSIVSYYLIYYMPSIIHMKCLYGPKIEDESTMAESLIESGRASTIIDENDEALLESERQKKCPHSLQESEKHPEKTRKTFYIGLNVVGVLLGIFGVYEVIHSVIYSEGEIINFIN